MPELVVWKASDASTQGMEDVYKLVYIRRPQDSKFSDSQMVSDLTLSATQVTDECNSSCGSMHCSMPR